MKLHTILDYDGCMPSFVHITDGKTHESTLAKTLSFPKGCVVVVDRGYVDYAWMNVLDSTGCFFVTRSKSNMKYTVLKSWKSDELKEAGVIEDQVIALDGVSATRYGDKKMRLVRVWDSIKNVEYEFLTNHFQWKAATVAALYKERWEIETFFKHLKQRLKVTSFVGLSFQYLSTPPIESFCNKACRLPHRILIHFSISLTRNPIADSALSLLKISSELICRSK